MNQNVYELERNKLIPKAEDFANRKTAGLRGAKKRETWNRLFHDQMNVLAGSIYIESRTEIAKS